MNEEVKEIFKTNKAYKLDDICKKIKTMSKEDIQKELNELEFNGFLIKENNKYRLFPKDYKLVNIRIDTNGNGFFYVNDDFYVIEEKNLNGTLNGDLCTVNMFTGKVHSIVKRKSNLVICEVKDGNYIITNNNKNYLIEIENSSTKGLVDGNIILLRIKNYDKNTLKCNLVEVLGHVNDPDIELKKIAIANNFNIDFSKDAIKQADSIKETVQEDELEGRLDLRDKLIYTIDDDHTKDMDDAISIEINDKGNYVIGVHIADVSHYIKPNTPLFNEALERGNSLYMLDTVIPMLMHKLSNGICSLNPNVDRLAISCIMEITPNGKIVSHDIFESIIRSRIQMTYKKVNKILNDEETPEGYEPFKDDLKLMWELAKILRKEKLARGYLDFDVDEPKILVDENCKPYDVVLRERGKGENMIEDFMIAANETVAEHVFYMGLPFVYRVHEVPDNEKVEEFLNSISMLGYHIVGDRNFVYPKSMKKILDQLRDKEGFEILSTLLLRCMKKAVYKPENLGHYGLASKCYTHFTSPIRRFPDTTVHNLLRKYIFNEPNDKELNRLIEYWEENLPALCDHASEKERDSIDCERDVESMKMAEYMESHVGEEYDGTISSVMNFGLFVQLDNMIEGLVHISEIKGDYYTFDETTHTLRGEKKGKMYKLGQKVRVVVTNASKENSTIDFNLVEGNKNGNNKQES